MSLLRSGRGCNALDALLSLSLSASVPSQVLALMKLGRPTGQGAKAASRPLPVRSYGPQSRTAETELSTRASFKEPSESLRLSIWMTS